MSPNQKFATLRCDNCGKTFDIASNLDGTWKSQARYPHCKDILEVDMGGEEKSSG
jgi:phage FluMu protein Com